MSKAIKIFFLANFYFSFYGNLKAVKQSPLLYKYIFSQPTSVLQKNSRRVSSEKNSLNSSVESCRVVWSRVE